MSAESPSAGNNSHRVVQQGSRATLEVQRFLRHPPEVVWRALTDPDEVARWMLTESHLEPRIGGAIELHTGKERIRASGRVLTWDPPRIFEHEWNTDRATSPWGEERSVVRWELVPRDGGTLLLLTHRELSPRVAQVFQQGMIAFLERLEAQLEGKPLPDWEGRVRELQGPRGAWS